MFVNVLGPALVLLLSAIAAPAQSAALVAREFKIPALDAGVELSLLERVPASLDRAGKSAPVVLFVHGATFPSSVGFDFDAQPGGSWMRYVAERGFDVYALDVRGYGASTRPAAMTEPPASNPPFADTRDAVRDISAAVDAILARRHAAQLTLVGWSWGTTTTAAYAADHADKVAKLVLVSPVWVPLKAPPYSGAYRSSTREFTRAFVTAGIPADRVEEISPAAQFVRLWSALLATDRDGARAEVPVVRAPNGVLKDFNESWAKGTPLYDPARIIAPTLLAVGEWDVITPPTLAQTLFGELRNARDRRVVVISEGTHCLLLETRRLRLMREVQNFLEESP